MRYSSLLALLLFSLCLNVQAQTTQSKKNLPIRFYMPKGYWERIDFYDTLSGTLLRSFDVIKSNPYNNFPYKVVKQGPRGVSYYEIPDSARNRLAYWISPEWAKEASADHAPRSADHTPYYVTSEFTSTGFQSGYKSVGIVYQMFTYNRKDSLLAIHSTYCILDSVGNVSNFGHLPEKTRPIYISISYSGRYVSIIRANYVKMGELQESKIGIYDTKAMRTLFETSMAESDEVISVIPVGENNFLYKTYLHEKGELFTIINVQNNTLYQKIYSRQEYDNNIKRVDRYGVTLKNSGIIEKYTDFPNKKIGQK